MNSVDVLQTEAAAVPVETGMPCIGQWNAHGLLNQLVSHTRTEQWLSSFWVEQGMFV